MGICAGKESFFCMVGSVIYIYICQLYSSFAKNCVSSCNSTAQKQHSLQPFSPMQTHARLWIGIHQSMSLSESVHTNGPPQAITRTWELGLPLGAPPTRAIHKWYTLNHPQIVRFWRGPTGQSPIHERRQYEVTTDVGAVGNHYSTINRH